MIPQYADTDYAGDGDDEEDAYIDVDGVMVPERESKTPEPDFVPLVKVGSSRAGIIARLAELVGETKEVQNANANSPQNLDVEINKQIKRVATDSLLKYREDKDFIEFYNSMGSDSSALEEIRAKVRSNLESQQPADLAVSTDTAEPETLSDRIRSFGDTGFVDPDDYETLMETGFDGDIAEADYFGRFGDHAGPGLPGGCPGDAAGLAGRLPGSGRTPGRVPGRVCRWAGGQPAQHPRYGRC